MAFKGALMLSDKDNVATSLEDFQPGTKVKVQLGEKDIQVQTLDHIPFGFKVAVTDIPKGDHVIKYGEFIGIASSEIKTGNLVHIHNLGGARGRGDLVEGAEK
jgi:altronate dehydratase small subunit